MTGTLIFAKLYGSGFIIFEYMSKQAVIETGGKQYLVGLKDKISIEKLNVQEGENVDFDRVLLVVDNDKIALGKPYLDGVKVSGRVVSQTKADKLVVFKYRAKSRYRRKTGHRQKLTVVEIQGIS